MTTRTAPATSTPPRITSEMARTLLLGGVASAPVIVGAWAVQALTRSGYDPLRHPMSLLSLGAGGWVQIANFIVTGLLVIAFALGLRGTLRGSRGGTWAPLLFAATGIGLIVAGGFPADPGAGFPAGAPEGAPVMTTTGILHEVGFVLAMVSWTAGVLVLRSHFARTGQRGWKHAAVIMVIAVIVLSAVPDAGSFTVRTMIATAIQFGFLGAVALHERRLTRPRRAA